MQAPLAKLSMMRFFAVYSTYFGGIQFMQNNTDKRLNRFLEISRLREISSIE